VPAAAIRKPAISAAQENGVTTFQSPVMAPGDRQIAKQL
jgi:hypothetical protein